MLMVENWIGASTMRRFRIPAVLALLLGTLQLGGCAGLIVGGAATAGVAAYQERGIKGVAADTTTATRIRAKLLDTNEELFRDVGIEVYEGRALLTGRVPSEERRADAVRIAWTVENVTDVINEIEVSESPLSDIANDSWITTQLQSKMTFDQDILAINYSIETVGAVIYLIGIAQDKEELDRVINHARSIKYVKRVVSHVRVKEPVKS